MGARKQSIAEPEPAGNGRMSNLTNNNKQAQMGKGKWLKRKFIPFFTLLLVISIMVGIFYFYKNYPGRISELKAYGYLGAFLISLIFNATIILPAGNILIMAVLGATLPSASLVGLVGGAGAAIGEVTGYMAGYSGRALVRRQKTYTKIEMWVKKWGALPIFFISIIPFFFDLAGIAAGALRLPLWKFLLACWLGRTILYILIALAGASGWESVLHYLS